MNKFWIFLNEFSSTNNDYKNEIKYGMSLKCNTIKNYKIAFFGGANFCDSSLELKSRKSKLGAAVFSVKLCGGLRNVKKNSSLKTE